jgi:K+-transporting ATPase ATPase B chain
MLWLTVWFANFAEALAEARGKAQAASLRRARRDVTAYRYDPQTGNVIGECAASELRKDDTVRVEAGQMIPADGEVIEGVASVDESAVTGESAPVIRESGGDRSAVTGGTRVLSDSLIIRVTTDPGESFLDRMIAMVEGAARQKTPNEIALTLVLAGFTIAFLMVCVALYPIGTFFNMQIDVPTLVALLVCLIPTTIGALLAAIGIAGMARLGQKNVLAMSGRAVEAAGDVDVLLLDKTGVVYSPLETQMLFAQVGLSNAKRILYGGELISAEAALRMNLVDHLCDGGALQGALSFCEQMVENAPLSIAAAKLTLNALATGELRSQIERIEELAARAVASDDYRVGVQAFINKRKPVFSGQ